MRLISLELREWRTYAQCPIEFPDGLVGIGGPNGTGKSTLIEAIGWTLFGKLRPGATIGDLRRQGGSGRPTAELVFQIGDTTYTIHRVARGDCTLWIGDPDGEPEAIGATNVTRRIAQELDLTWDVFKRSVFAEQKDLAALDPKATGPARRAHVERLLGLARYKRAADGARAEAKRLESEITGRIAELDDERELAKSLSEAQDAAEQDSPRVNEIQQGLDGAEDRYKAAREAVEEEHARTKEAARLEERRTAAIKTARTAADRHDEIVRRIEERDAAAKRLTEVEPESRQAPQAERELHALDALEEATRDLEAARRCLQEIAHDPEAQSRDEARLEELEQEQGQLRPDLASLDARIGLLEQRRLALADAAAAGSVEDRQSEFDIAAEEERRLDREISHLERRIVEDRDHVAAVREGGADSPCPVCRKPYGDEYDEIVAEHETQIAGAERDRPELQAALMRAVAERQAAHDLLTAATDAARALSRTNGPDTLHECEEALGADHDRREQIARALRGIDAELPALQAALKKARSRAERWAGAHAIVEERQRHHAKAAQAAGQQRYDVVAHAAARERHERLASLATEAERLRATVAGGDALEDQLEEAGATMIAQREAASAIQAELDTLGIEEGRLEALREARRLSEEARDTLRSELEDARLLAQQQSDLVMALRRRLDALRQALVEVERRRLDLRRHQVAVDILEKFREHELQRAWPQLQQGASALLAAATGGRYADIRLSTDYKLTIVDRGEEHGLARYSGGEQDLANLCLRLAIAEWVAKERGTDISLVVLDEVFGSQDEDRRRLLLEQLRALSTRFRQMLIVTHLPDIADLCDSRIEVAIDDGGRSTALVAA